MVLAESAGRVYHSAPRTPDSSKGSEMVVDFLAWRRATSALAAVCLLAGGVGCSPFGWGYNEAKSLIHHHSFYSAPPTKALEAAAA